MVKQQPWLISFRYNSVHARGDAGGTSRIEATTVVIIDKPPWKYLAENMAERAKSHLPPYPKNGTRLPDEILAVYWAVQIPVGGLTEEEVDSLS